MPSSEGWIAEALAVSAQAGLRRTRRVRGGRSSIAIECDGRTLVSFASNDYLGLAADDRLAAASAAAVVQHGWGAAASPLVSGYTPPAAALEEKLAAFEGTEAALVFSSGYTANVGTVAALVGPGDVVFSDAWNHASLIDGCRLSRARIVVYPHADLGILEQLLEQNRDARRRLIVTDALFSMDGDFAPLDRLVPLAERTGTMLLVDEAHATGVWGESGRGVAEAQGVAHRVNIRVGTLSKSLGSGGGFVAGSRMLINYLVERARPYVFSTAPPAATLAAACAALEIVQAEPTRRHDLQARAASLRAALADQGWNLGSSTSQIVPLVLGTPEQALALAEQLAQAGLYVPAIRPPSVPPGTSRLRIALSWLHTPAMIEQLLDALGRCRQQ